MKEEARRAAWKLKGHECDLDEIEWEKNPVCGSEEVYFKGECPRCGKRYESVYTYSGIWDSDKREMVYEA